MLHIVTIIVAGADTAGSRISGVWLPRKKRGGRADSRKAEVQIIGQNFQACSGARGVHLIRLNNPRLITPGNRDLDRLSAYRFKRVRRGRAVRNKNLGNFTTVRIGLDDVSSGVSLENTPACLVIWPGHSKVRRGVDGKRPKCGGTIRLFVPPQILLVLGKKRDRPRHRWGGKAGARVILHG